MLCSFYPGKKIKYLLNINIKLGNSFIKGTVKVISFKKRMTCPIHIGAL